MLVILGPFYVEMENLQLDLWNETDPAEFSKFHEFKAEFQWKNDLDNQLQHLRWLYLKTTSPMILWSENVRRAQISACHHRSLFLHERHLGNGHFVYSFLCEFDWEIGKHYKHHFETSNHSSLLSSSLYSQNLCHRGAHSPKCWVWTKFSCSRGTSTKDLFSLLMSVHAHSCPYKCGHMWKWHQQPLSTTHCWQVLRPLADVSKRFLWECGCATKIRKKHQWSLRVPIASGLSMCRS